MAAGGAQSAPASIGVSAAIRDLRAGKTRDEPITIVGYVVRTNYAAAPACAVHAVGKADPPGCTAPVPTFWLADTATGSDEAIAVAGWASNFAQIYTMITRIDRAPKGEEADVRQDDEFWGTELPNPLPEAGAKVTVTGTYGVTFTKSTRGVASDPKLGIMTAAKIEYLEPPRKKAALPGMRLRKRQ